MGANRDLAKRFFEAAAVADGDTLRSLCSADVELIQNGAPPAGIDVLVGMGPAILAAVPDFAYANAIRSDTDTGFVEEHDVTGTLADGTKLNVAVCVVATVKNGRVTSLREYLDTAAAAPLFKALGG